jgi:alpha-tubulin suppressor-like RCC1 family protein/sugar lactone lactonase YvrE
MVSPHAPGSWFLHRSRALAVIAWSLLALPVLAQEVVVTIAGGGVPSDPTQAAIGLAYGVAVAPDGTVFWSAGNRVMHRRADGLLEVVAGQEGSGFAGDGGHASLALLSNVHGLAIDQHGDLYIADASNLRIRKVTMATGIITTVAGGGSGSGPGDGGPATAAVFGYVAGLALDGSGDLFIADHNDHRVRRIDAVTGIITTVAGDGTWGPGGDNGPATAAKLSLPDGVAVDQAGNLFIADSGANTVRRVDAATGVITTVVGDGTYGYSGDGGLAISASLRSPESVVVDAAGDLLIADYGNSRIRRVDAATGIVTTIAGGLSALLGDGGAAVAAGLYGPQALALDAAGDLFVADFNHWRIRRIDAFSGIITTVAGNGDRCDSGDGGQATAAQFGRTPSIAFAPGGDLYIDDQEGSRIRKVSAMTGIITTVAGTGVYGFSGDGGPATAAQLSNPARIAFDGAGDLLIVDQNNHRVRKVATATGIITTIVGSGASSLTSGGQGSFTGDGGQATAATLNSPVGVCVAANGDLYIADMLNQRVRKVTAATGIITTVAGSGTATAPSTTVPGGFSGDGGLATTARLNIPVDVLVDSAGNVFLSDFANQRIRRISAADGTIATVAGDGTAAPTGDVLDGGLATAAHLFDPTALSLDPSGDLIISDRDHHRIRRVDHATGIISTIVGAGIAGFAGDGGPPTAALFDGPSMTAFDAAGDLFIADQYNHRVRRLVPDITAITWSPQAMTYGTALGAGQLDASASIAGTFSYNPVAGTVPSAGICALSAIFTPADQARYAFTSFTATASVTVAPALLSIVADDQQRTVGAADPPFTFHLVGLTNGDLASVLSAAPMLATTATATSPAGTYPITVDASGVTTANYLVSSIDGTLTVAGAGGGTAESGGGNHHCGPGSAAALAVLLGSLLMLRMRSGRRQAGYRANSLAALLVVSLSGSLTAADTWIEVGTPSLTPISLSGAARVVMGDVHALALMRDGTVVGWGDDTYGEATTPALLGAVTSVAAGRGFSLALKRDGTVAAWGSGFNGETNVPSGLTGVTAIAAGMSFAVAAKADGTVAIWGSIGAYGLSTVPSGLAGITAIAAGNAFAVVVHDGGSVTAWGYGIDGETAVPAGLSGVIAVACGSAHTLALKSDGTVVAWGLDSHGDCQVPPGLSGVVAIAAGGGHSLALKSDGTVVAWGEDFYGELTAVNNLMGPVSAIAAANDRVAVVMPDGTLRLWGDNTWGMVPPPADLDGVTSIAAGTHHTIAVKGDGTVMGWGENGAGQITMPAGLGGVVAVAAGAAFSVGLRGDGTVVAWGDNAAGQSTVPVGLGNIQAIAAGDRFALALSNSGTVVAWGDNTSGQTNVPAGLTGVVAISACGGTAVALKNDGTVVGWGDDLVGQATVPSGLAGVTAISAGNAFDMALKSDGTVVGWGSVNGLTSNVTGAIAIAAGDQLGLALLANGTARTTLYAVENYGDGYIPPDLTGIRRIVAAHYQTWLKVPAKPANPIIFHDAAAVYDGTSKTITIVTSNGRRPTSVTYDGSYDPPSAIGSYTVVATADYLGSYGTATTSFRIGRAQTISTFPAIGSQTFGVAPVALSATTSSGLAPVFTVLDGPATISGTMLTITGAGTVVIAADQPGDATYLAAARVIQSVSVSKAAQSIVFPAIHNQSLSASPFGLSATASSGLPIAFGVVSGPATLTGSSLTLTGLGTVVVTANQSGSVDFLPATQAIRAFTVLSGSQTITFAAIPAQVVGAAPLQLVATASSGLAVAFTVVSGPATVSGSSLTLTGTGTVVVEADQPGNATVPAAPPVTRSFAVTDSAGTADTGGSSGKSGVLGCGLGSGAAAAVMLLLVVAMRHLWAHRIGEGGPAP